MISEMPYRLYNHATKQWDSVDNPHTLDRAAALQYCPESERANMVILIESGCSPWLALLLSLRLGA